jgi:hypothetical protein
MQSISHLAPGSVYLQFCLPPPNSHRRQDRQGRISLAPGPSPEALGEEVTRIQIFVSK